MSVQTLAKPVSEKQTAFIKSLCEQKGVEYVYDPTLTGGFNGTASKRIAELMALPKVAKVGPSKKDEPADGIYKFSLNGATQVYKVYKMVHGSGRQGVKGMKVRTNPDGTKYGEFNYLGLAVKHLPEGAVKMGKDEATKYGQMYGFCVRCGKTLTDEKSIAQGMGSWCASQEW